MVFVRRGFVFCSAGAKSVFSAAQVTVFNEFVSELFYFFDGGSVCGKNGDRFEVFYVALRFFELESFFLDSCFGLAIFFEVVLRVL